LRFEDFDTAPRDGRGFLAYGRHTADQPPGAAHGVRAGDHWYAILVFDIWRPAGGFVFAKDGAPAWEGAIGWTELSPADEAPTSEPAVVTDRDTIAFLENAFRNVELPVMGHDALDEIKSALRDFVTHRTGQERSGGQ